MTEWFECKVRYDKALDDGKQKKVTEPYLVDALSFTEAEKRIIEEVSPFMTGEFLVSDIKRAKIAELIENADTTADKWYRCKVAFITIDEKTAVEKRTTQVMLVQATDLQNAVATLEKAMANTLGDWAITAVTETAILDVYRYKVAEDDVKPEFPET